MKRQAEPVKAAARSAVCLLTKQELAAEWRVTVRTIDRMMYLGKLPFVKLPCNRTVRFRADVIDSLTQGGSANA